MPNIFKYIDINLMSKIFQNSNESIIKFYKLIFNRIGTINEEHKKMLRKFVKLIKAEDQNCDECLQIGIIIIEYISQVIVLRYDIIILNFLIILFFNFSE